MTKEQLEQKLGQLVMQISKLQTELQRLQKEANDTATEIEKISLTNLS